MGSTAPVVAQEPVEIAVHQEPADVTVQAPATEQPEPTVASKAKAIKEAAKKE